MGVLSTPRIAAMAPGRATPCSYMSVPRWRTMRAAAANPSAPVTWYAENSPSECPAAARTLPPMTSRSTAQTAALCDRSAGCAFSVRVRSSAGPSKASVDSAVPTASSTV
jgi:hypothetical protein